MKRLTNMTIMLTLATLLAAAPALAKGHSFTVSRDVTLNGSQLEAKKTYRLELNGNDEALIYHGRELVATATVEVKPLAPGVHANAFKVNKDGVLLEVRTKNQQIIFVQPPSSQPSPAANLRPILLS